MAKGKNLEGQGTLNLFPGNETGGITSQKRGAGTEIKKTLSKSRQTNSVAEFLDEKGKLDVAGLIAKGKASELARAFAEDLERQKARKSDYRYHKELEDFLGKTGYDDKKIKFDGSIDGLKKLFQFIHENKPTTHVLDGKKTQKYLQFRTEKNKNIDLLLKRLSISPDTGRLYDRFYKDIIFDFKDPKIIQFQVPGIITEKIAKKTKEFFVQQGININEKDLKDLSEMIDEIDIFRAGITSIDYRSLSMGLRAYIKEDKKKRQELNSLSLTPARLSSYLSSLFKSYNNTQDEKDGETNRKIQALNKTFEIQFLRNYKDKNKKADRNVIYRKDIDTKTEILQTMTDTEKNSFSKEEIAVIKKDLKTMTHKSVFYFMTEEVHGFITAEKLINIIYNNLDQSPKAIKQILKDNFADGKKIRPEDEDTVTIFIQTAVKYFQKHRKASPGATFL